MINRELGSLISALPLAPTNSRQERRLLRGATEQAVVRILMEQRARYCQSNGQVSLCLTQEELAKQLGLPYETHEERQRAGEMIRVTIWRVNPKLAAHNLVIANLHFLSLGRFAIFHLQEVWAVS